MQIIIFFYLYGILVFHGIFVVSMAASKEDHLFNSRDICFSVSNLKLGKLLELACTLSEYWHSFKQIQDVWQCSNLFKIEL